eukprot:GGOE01000854.1.p1 GENE.GGOE01000854.1~~GGOE01000854.1.p1  ORF type:complete len:461 (+),score=151.06 GGOE01000854.1:75-1457(+)
MRPSSRPTKAVYEQLQYGTHNPISPMSACTAAELRHIYTRAVTLHPLRASLTSSEMTPLLHLEDTDAVRSTGFAKVVFHLLCAVLGAGVLGLPSALVQTHWSGLLLMVGVAVVLNCSAQCLTHCALMDPGVLTYRDVGQRAFGASGQMAVLVCQVITCVGPAVLFLILMGQNIGLLLEGRLRPTESTCLAAMCTLPLCFFRTFGDVGIVSLGGLLASLVAIGCVSASILLNGLRSHPVEFAPGSTAAGLVSVTARSCFAYGGHAVFPGILRVMRQPTEFPAALTVSFVLISCIYVLFSALCYSTFGAGTKENVLENLPPDKLRDASLLMVTIHINAAFCLYMNPVFYLIEERLGVENRSGAEQDGVQVLGRVLLRSVLVLLLLAVALAVPYLGAVMDLVGGTVYLGMGLLLPLVFYWKLQRPALSRMQEAALWLLVGGGLLLSLASTTLTVGKIISHSKS